jgi:hypothetical protein
VTGENYDEEFHVLCVLSNDVRVTKRRKIRWMGPVACTGEETKEYIFWVGSLKKIDHLEDLHIDGRIILKWILKK